MLGDLTDELAHEERVALGGGHAGVHETLVGLLARLRGEQRAEGRRSERGRTHESRARLPEQLLEQLLVPLVLTRPAGNRERHRKVLDAAGEVGEEGERRRIGPLRVVDEHEQRRAFGEGGAQPVQAMQHRERALVLLPAPRELEDRGAQGGGPVHQLVAAGTGHARLEELPHDAERELALELGAARAQHAHAALAGLAAGRDQQLGLPDAARPFHDERRAGTGTGRLEPLADLIQLALALEQACRGRGAHGSMLPPEPPRARSRGRASQLARS